MKIKDGYILRSVAGSNIVVAVGEESRKFNKLIKLNNSAAFIFKQLEEDVTEDEIVEKMLSEYDVAEETAREDARALIATLREAGLIVR